MSRSRNVWTAAALATVVSMLFALVFHLLAVSGLVPGANEAADARKAAIQAAAERANTIEGVFVDRFGEPITLAPATPGTPAQPVDPEATSYLIGYSSAIFGESGLRARCRTADGGKDGVGPEVHLTIDSQLQAFCYKQLEGSEGSVIVLDADTGEILAMTSRSSGELGFDLTRLEENWSVYNAIDGFWYDRCLFAEDPPGSCFKLTTAASLIEHSAADFQCSDDGGEYKVAGTVLHNAGNASFGDQIDLQTALTSSINIYFAKAAAEQLGARTLTETARGFLYGETFETDLGRISGTFGLNENSNKLLLTQTAFGQGRTAACPLQICLTMSAVISCSGKIPRPYVVDFTVDDGKQSRKTRPETLSAPISPKTADTLRAMLCNTAEAYGFDPDLYGTAAMKTGTADQANGLNHIYLLCGVEHGDRHLCILIDRRNTTEPSGALFPQMKEILTYLQS